MSNTSTKDTHKLVIVGKPSGTLESTDKKDIRELKQRVESLEEKLGCVTDLLERLFAILNKKDTQ